MLPSRMSPSGSLRKRRPGRSRPTPARAVRGSRRGGILGEIAWRSLAKVAGSAGDPLLPERHKPLHRYRAAEDRGPVRAPTLSCSLMRSDRRQVVSACWGFGLLVADLAIGTGSRPDPRSKRRKRQKLLIRNRSLHVHSRGRDPARQVDFGLMSGPALAQRLQTTWGAVITFARHSCSSHVAVDQGQAARLIHRPAQAGVGGVEHRDLHQLAHLVGADGERDLLAVRFAARRDRRWLRSPPDPPW